MADAEMKRDPLEVLAAEYIQRLRQGDAPSVTEYAAQHPELAEEIQDLFPTIAVTERLKSRQARFSGGRAALGAARPERLGDFRLIREIGRGGMGVVFEAEQESLARRVAVKVLPRQVLLDEKRLKRFQDEARIAANLHHTNIVEVFGVGEQDGFHYYVMQYIRGVGLNAIIPLLAKRGSEPQDLSPPPAGAAATPAGPDGDMAEAATQQLLGGKDGIRPDGRLGPYYWQSVARLGRQAAEALRHAHSQGVLHRDIKPANLLLDPHGTLWLADFGLAKAAQSADPSLSNDVVGTVRYMAPEQFGGHTDQRSDIYSLGLTLYELLTLHSAYEETDPSRLMQRITQGPPLAPSLVCRNIPRDLETIILKAISHDASQRYQSAALLADDLDRFLADRPIRARRVGPVERLGRWCRRNKSLAGLTGATLLLIVLVGVVGAIGYVRTKSASRDKAIERAKAEANASLAVEALDRMFERLSPTRIGILSRLAGGGTESSGNPRSPVLSKEAAALLEEMLPFYDRLARQTGKDDKIRVGTAEANRRVGAIRQRLGQMEEAVKAYQRAIALFREPGTHSPTNPNLRLEVAQIENELGDLYTARRQTAEARQAHLAALALLQGGAASPTAPVAWRFELARTYYALGTQDRPLPAAAPPEEVGPLTLPEEQRSDLAQAVALLNGLAAADAHNPEYRHLLALCYLEGATVEDGGPAEGGDEHAIGILEPLVKAYPGIPDYAYDLSEAYARMHLPPAPIPPEVERAITDRLGKSLGLLEKLAIRYPDIPDFIAAEARVQHQFGSFHRQMDHWAEAERSFRQAVLIQTSLVKQFPDTPQFGCWMATYRIALADALIRQHHPREARTELEETISTLLSHLEKRSDIQPPHNLLALGYATLEVALREAGEASLADEAAHKAEQQQSSLRPSR